MKMELEETDTSVSGQAHCRHLTHLRVDLILAPSVREYVFFVFFRFQKNMTFYVFFEMTFQKNVKSHKSIKFAECL